MIMHYWIFSLVYFDFCYHLSHRVTYIPVSKSSTILVKVDELILEKLLIPGLVSIMYP